MTDNLKPHDRRRTMQAVKGRRTKLEKRLFAMLAGLGVSGWKQNDSRVFGKPDVAFANERVAIFVDGCFWHGCPHCQRPLPQTNREYWERKINRNIALARMHNRRLRREGWTVIRVWEHEMSDLPKIKARIRRALERKEQV